MYICASRLSRKHPQTGFLKTRPRPLTAHESRFLDSLPVFFVSQTLNNCVHNIAFVFLPLKSNERPIFISRSNTTLHPAPVIFQSRSTAPCLDHDSAGSQHEADESVFKSVSEPSHASAFLHSVSLKLNIYFQKLTGLIQHKPYPSTDHLKTLMRHKLHK